MSILILRLAGPLQAWGTDSKLADRGTGVYPSKSGVMGIIAAAQGRTRNADISDLAALPFGVAVRRPGSAATDIQTAIAGGASYKDAAGNQRYFFQKVYLQDAVFYAGIECDQAKAESFIYALQHPAYPLFLGRRSCPVTQPLVIGVYDTDMETALIDAAKQEPVRLSEQNKSYVVRLILENNNGDPVRDVPVSYDPERRMFTGRRIKERSIECI